MEAGGEPQGLLARLAAGGAMAVDHINAYVELLIVDVERSARSAAAQLWAAVIMILALGFTVALGCVWLIAETWNTPARRWVLGGLLLFGALVATISYLRLTRERRAAPRLLSITTEEWAKDHRLLQELLRRHRQGRQ